MNSPVANRRLKNAKIRSFFQPVSSPLYRANAVRDALLEREREDRAREADSVRRETMLKNTEDARKRRRVEGRVIGDLILDIREAIDAAIIDEEDEEENDDDGNHRRNYAKRPQNWIAIAMFCREEGPNTGSAVR